MFKFKCKKCKQTFPLEAHPSNAFKTFQEQLATNTGTGSDKLVDTIVDYIMKMTKSIHCPQCNASAYLNIEGRDIDLVGTPMERLIKAAIDAVNQGRYEDYKSLANDIIESLLDEPGQLIYIEDPDLLKDVENAISNIWEYTDSDDLFDGMVESCSMVSIIGDRVARAKKLKPTFVSTPPSDDFSAYYQNAISCWLYGLNDAAIILSWSLLEARLKEKNHVIAGQCKDQAEFIDKLRERNLIDNLTRDKAHNLRKLRNRIVHQLRHSTSDQAYSALVDTKQIIQKLYT